VSASPIKARAESAGLPVLQPTKLADGNFLEAARALEPELGVVAAYGRLLPEVVLALPRLGLVNVHASLLPRWRGAAPIQRAILAGDAETGVCLMQMDAGLDTGPVLLSESTSIGADDTGGALHDRLGAIGARVLTEGLRRVTAGEVLHATPQPAVGATYARKLDKAEANLDFARPANQLERKVRAFDPWPVAEADVVGERVRVWQAEARERESGIKGRARPGTIVAASKHGIDIACGEGVLRILKLQRAGGRVIGAADYLNARGELRTA